MCTKIGMSIQENLSGSALKHTKTKQISYIFCGGYMVDRGLQVRIPAANMEWLDVPV